MLRLSPISITAALTLMCLGACNSGTPLNFDLGDAEWDAAPIPTPGGQGQDGDGGDSAGSDSTGAGSTGTSGTSSSGFPTTGGSAESSSGDGDGDGDGDGSGDGDTGGEPCQVPFMGTSCTDVAGVCEAPPDDTGGGSQVPCCIDDDCLCMDAECGATPCQADNYCDCACSAGADPDCQADSCAMPLIENPPIDEVETKAGGACPDTRDDVILYMSNDDSNSQASPIFARHVINQGRFPDSSAIRIHEFLNYYDLGELGNGEDPADVGVQVRRTDAAQGEFTFLLYAAGKRITPEERPQLNLTFSVDTSGSMSGLPMENLRSTLRHAVRNLRAGDVVSVVEWSSSQSVHLDGHVVTGADDATLLAIVDGLDSGGGTDLSGGLVRAYQLAESHYDSDALNRVFLISDGGANLGVTDAELIANSADDANRDGIYMIGVGVGHDSNYRDELMDEVTDAGKGAYVYIDSDDEAGRMFGDTDHFISNLFVSARDVQMQLTMPWYFDIKEFHGEEYSADPAEVEPQHLALNDVMGFHNVVQSCDPAKVNGNDLITARVTYTDPATGEQRSDERSVSMVDAVKADAKSLHKADVIVSYAKALIVLDDMLDNGLQTEATDTALAMQEWLEGASDALGDSEVGEMAVLMGRYAQNI